MKKQIEKNSMKNTKVIEGAICELIVIIADDLRIGFQDSDDIVRSTDFYKILLSECVLQDDYDLVGLNLILRKELIRSSKYPTVENKPIADFFDFVKTMKPEIIHNISLCLKLNLNLTQLSLLLLGIENFTINEKGVILVHDISTLFERCLDYLEPMKTRNLDEIWWRLNSFIQTLLLHCKMSDISPKDLTAEEISGYLKEEM